MASADELSENPDWTAVVAERQIQDAMEQGLFDNLPGRGQPLDLTPNPFEPPGMGAVNRLLKNNKVVPPWLMLEQEIEASRQTAINTLARWERAEPSLRGTPKYAPRRERARREYEKQLRETNDLILKYNLAAPFVHRSPAPFQVKARLTEFDSRYPSEVIK